MPKKHRRSYTTLYIFIGAVATECFLGTAHHQVHSASNEAAVVTIHRKEATNHPTTTSMH